jgi:hypothetical protein
MKPGLLLDSHPSGFRIRSAEKSAEFVAARSVAKRASRKSYSPFIAKNRPLI